MKCSRWFVIGRLLPRVKWAHPHVSMTLLSKDIPLIFFNGSLWNLLLWCSIWLLGRGLIASQWSWETDWSPEWNEPTPLSLCHCDPELCSIQNPYVISHSRKNTVLPGSWARLHHSMSMGQFWAALAPQGYNLHPILRYGLREPVSLFKRGNSHDSTKFSLGAMTRQSSSQC